ncbi:sulfotransferase [Alkalilacustris brevis]|uniref:sulfotransferase n=1 Tax=Alkalilacustris brevis TaxID=2026338 RepID=UPI000E0D24B4|nr:sulfotransferase [Alkalilacustris brevis]
MAQATLMFGLGATRAGTSWLNRYLTDHPECHLREVKEAHYFDTLERGSHDWRIRQLLTRRAELAARLRDAGAAAQRARLERNIAAHDALIALFERRQADHAAYLAYLENGRAAEARVIGEITPAYSLLPEPRLHEMRRLAPVVRFFYVLRDPVARLWSNIRQTAPTRPEGRADPAGAARAMMDRWLAGGEAEIDRRCDYRGALERIFAAIPAGERLILFYETLFSEASIRRLTGFLGIGYVVPDTARRVYEGVSLALDPALAAAAREKLAPQYAYVRDTFGELPPGWAAQQPEV